MRPDPEVQRIAEAVRRELEAIYAELRLSQTQRATLIANVLENGYRLMQETGIK